MNFYNTLPSIKSHLDIDSTDTSFDSRLTACLLAASREIDDFCRRHFYTKTASRIFDGPEHSGCRLVIDDVLSITSMVADTDQDGVWDDETWVEDTDFYLYPNNVWPKREIITAINGSFVFGHYPRGYKITGVWGYGNGTSDPWQTTTITGTVATTGGTTLTVSADGTLEVGHTIKIGSEQMYVSAVGTGSVTVDRNVNGTTATTHTTASISLAAYPEAVRIYALHIASEHFTSIQNAGVMSESIGGEYSFTMSSAGNREAMARQFVGVYQRQII